MPSIEAFDWLSCGHGHCSLGVRWCLLSVGPAVNARESSMARAPSAGFLSTFERIPFVDFHNLKRRWASSPIYLIEFLWGLNELIH